MNLQSIGGRRFLLAILVGLVTTILTWYQKIDGSAYTLVTLGTVGAFITGNVVESIKTPKV